MKARISVIVDGKQQFDEVEVESIVEIEGIKLFFRIVPSPFDEYGDLEDEEDEDWYKLNDWDSGWGFTQPMPEKDFCINQAKSFFTKYGIEEIKRRIDEHVAHDGRANE
jgi:hypothetical protein